MIGKLLVANRGEIAIRIIETAAEMGIATVAVFAADDHLSAHVARAGTAVPLTGSGPAAYLDIGSLLAAARLSGADAVHPGYGFLSESAAFARACAEAGLTFVGPSADTLSLFGDKVQARALAQRLGVAVPAGIAGPATPGQMQQFRDALPAGRRMVIKAMHGGGGRGMALIDHASDISAAHARCTREALSAFGDGGLYAESYLEEARHIEVQLLGDGSGNAIHLWDRECSLQRRRQKLIEWAPAHLVPAVRSRLLDASLAMAKDARLTSLATCEFLVTPSGEWAFIEANPRLQVEHTVTEEVTGLDLVRLQLLIAGGATLASLGLDQQAIGDPAGTAIEARINLERQGADGRIHPATGTLTRYRPPAGRRLRVDGCGRDGLEISPRYDSLIAKLVVQVPQPVEDGGLAAAAVKAERALARFALEGVASNIPQLQALLSRPEVQAGAVDTGFIDRIAAELPGQQPDDAPSDAPPISGAAATNSIVAPVTGVIAALGASEQAEVAAGQELAVIEAMKMHHGLPAPSPGVIRQWLVQPGDNVSEGQPLAIWESLAGTDGAAATVAAAPDPDHIRPDLAELQERRRLTTDSARPQAVARRRRTGQLTARENLANLFDPESFVEYGGLALAARSGRASPEELIAQSPADGMVMGIGTIHADRVGRDHARVAAMAYDYSVFAGTQGARNHLKTDRLAELAARWRLPLVMFAEGGGGRPGDTEGGGFIRAFELLPKLSGKVPLVGVVSGRCFAGNAAFLACSDVIIATRGTTIGMGGPAMIEGGGLGVFRPEEVGPVEMHATTGVVDLLVDDEAEAARAARRYLSYFQGPRSDWECADQRLLRHAIPENRLRIYDIRKLIDTLADSGSVLELRRDFGRAMVTALARIEGRPVGIIANNPAVIGGAIDSDAADKAARFMQICEAFGLPLLSLSDTPGIMVGPEVEKTALVRHAARMFLTGANLSVPILSVVLRKSYGLGAIAMTGGSYQASMFAVSWPTGEFGGMGLEGAVRLGYRKELEAIADPVARQAWFDDMVARHYAHGKAITTASHYAIDDVIDPCDTRRWIVAALEAVPKRQQPSAEAPPPRWIDSW